MNVLPFCSLSAANYKYVINKTIPIVIPLLKRLMLEVGLVERGIVLLFFECSYAIKVELVTLKEASYSTKRIGLSDFGGYCFVLFVFQVRLHKNFTFSRGR